MPVVTTLFRNLFDIIFTIFYGCRTVFNGAGPLLTLPAPFDVRFIWLIRFWTVPQPWQTAIHSVNHRAHCATLCMYYCARVACALCSCVCVCCVLYVYVLYVGVQVYVCVHSVVLMVCSGYFGNLFGIIFRKVKVYAGHFTYHFLDFFGVSML